MYVGDRFGGNQTGVRELAGKALDEQTLALPCRLNGVREKGTLRLPTPLAEERFMWFLENHLTHLGY